MAVKPLLPAESKSTVGGTIAVNFLTNNIVSVPFPGNYLLNQASADTTKVARPIQNEG